MWLDVGDVGSRMDVGVGGVGRRMHEDVGGG